MNQLSILEILIVVDHVDSTGMIIDGALVQSWNCPLFVLKDQRSFVWHSASTLVPSFDCLPFVSRRVLAIVHAVLEQPVFVWLRLRLFSTRQFLRIRDLIGVEKSVKDYFRKYLTSPLKDFSRIDLDVFVDSFTSEREVHRRCV